MDDKESYSIEEVAKMMYFYRLFSGITSDDPSRRAEEIRKLYNRYVPKGI